ncbi:hypothetical protein KR018_004020 [Drosophila ironensis]|nr:hypothetical protein KR018_004020 [Drosophila ironensis]
MKGLCFILYAVSVWCVFSANAEIKISLDDWLFWKQYSSCLALNPKKSGVQQIKIGDEKMKVYCDVNIAGKGWLVVQRRVSVEENFYRNWTSYEQGFGNIEKNYFIGLDKLNKLTSFEPQELYVHLEDFSGQSRYARYDHFIVGNATGNYSLDSLGNYNGTAGDSLRSHLSFPFSTYDRDNDNSTINCAAKYTGAWWYKNCYVRYVFAENSRLKTIQSSNFNSNLNGAYLGNGTFTDTYLVGNGITWNSWLRDSVSLRSVYMLLRPKL